MRHHATSATDLPGMPRQTDSTRERIQCTALELFTANGYEATSLREIAERLNVTKAALYYHFKSKDEILQSLVDDRIAMIDELLAWAATQPRNEGTRREFLRRYADLLAEHSHNELMRFFERNQSSKHKAGALMRRRVVEIQQLLCEPDAPLTDKIRSSLAILALHSSWFTVPDRSVTDDQRRAAALEVALSLVS